MIRTLLKPLSFVPALLLMYMIYSFSAQPGEVSSQLSYKVSYKIVNTVDEMLDAQMADWEIDTWVYRIHGLVRKLAHVTIYFALAVAVSFPLYVYGIRGIWLMLLAGFICVAFACGDEYHQSFVEGRGPSKRDVLIDSFGIFWGIILVRIVGWTGRQTIFRPTKKQLAKKERKAQLKAEKKAAKAAQRSGSYPPADDGAQYGSRPRRIRHDAEFNRLDEMLFENQELPDPTDWEAAWENEAPPYLRNERTHAASPVSQDTKIYERSMVSQDTVVYERPMTQKQ